jgi:hypothetical protein
MRTFQGCNNLPWNGRLLAGNSQNKRSAADPACTIGEIGLPRGAMQILVL